MLCVPNDYIFQEGFIMQKQRRFPKAAALLAAAVLTAGLPLSPRSGAVFSAPLTAYADEEYTTLENSQFSYKKYADHIEIMFPTDATRKASVLEIPDQIDSLPVTGIDIYGFQLCEMKTVKFPDTLVEIGPYAFSNCPNLESVTFPDSIQKVGFQSFRDNPKLTEINFPDHLVKTGDFTFDETPWLEAQRKKDPLVIINGAVIDGRSCEGKVTVPSGVKYVASGAFSRNTKITSVVFPQSVTEICDNTFWYCENLTSAELEGAETLGFGVFAACNKLTDLKISGKLKSIDGYSFCDNTASATITFYGSESAWRAVEKPENDPFLQKAKMIFDESHISEPEEVEGDLTGDGKCSIADAVMLQKYLLTSGTLTADQAKAADINKDQQLDSADLSRLKKLILGNQ